MTEKNIEIKNNAIVSVFELNQVLKHCNLENIGINISFKNSIDKFDIVFISGLYLLYKKLNTTFKIDYPNAISEKRIFEVRQYLKQIENLFGLTFSSVFQFFKGVSDLKEKDFITSTSFAPILYIDNDSYQQYFKSQLQNLELSLPLVNICNKYILDIIGNNITEKNYLSSKDSIFIELKNYTPIHTFVFAILYQKFNPFVSSKNKGIENPIKRTKQLWRFAQEYVKGLDELVKNIIEHSSTKNGIITIRVYDALENKTANGKVFQTHVFDFGEIGIINNLKQSTFYKKDSNKIFEEDLKILQNEYSLKDFIKPTVKNKLNQQLYRDLAHYGLTKFYKLIERNEGNIVSSTQVSTQARDKYSSSISVSDAICLGTNYFFELPFKPELFIESEETASTESTPQGTPLTISSLSEILKYKIVNNIDEILSRFDIFNVSPKLKEIRSREDEQILFKEFAGIKNQKQLKYIVIDMKEISLSASSLLRFMAHLSSNYLQSFIFYNIDFEKYDEMISDNKNFYQSVKDLDKIIPYWYENRSILIFSTIENGKFHFADILFGKNEQEFNSINHIVSHTFPNTNNILRNREIKIEDFNISQNVSTFFHQSSLLPFDILLLENDSKSLFESNLSTILDNNIKQA